MPEISPFSSTPVISNESSPMSWQDIQPDAAISIVHVQEESPRPAAETAASPAPALPLQKVHLTPEMSPCPSTQGIANESPLPPQESKIDTATSIVNSQEESHGPASIPVQKALPAGWVEQAEPSTGKVYYFSVSTNETTWDRPEETSSAEFAVSTTAAVESHEEAVISTSEPYVEQEEISEVEALLEGWVEQQDPTTGNVYYYNAMTNETTWKRPTRSVAPPAPEVNRDKHAEEDETERESEITVQPASETIEDPVTDVLGASIESEVAEEPAAASEPLAHGALPEGWIVQQDPTTDNVYYYNSATNETTWETPSSSIAPSASGVNGDYVLVVEDVTVNPSNDIVEPAEEVVEEPDPVVGDSNKTTVVAEPTPAAGPPKDDPLPEGWIEQQDPITGNVYYYHASTNETSWKRLSSSVSPSAPDASVSPGPVAEDEAPEVSEDLVDPLEQSVDQFVEEAAPVVKSSDTNVAEAPSEVAEPPTDDALPEGWIEQQDLTTGDVYYYNASTLETTWERPLSSVAPSAPKLNGDLVRETETVGMIQLVVEPAAENEAPIDVIADNIETEAAKESTIDGGRSTLHEEWVEQHDPTTGNVYYYNASTDETSWERPSSSMLPSTSDTNECPLPKEKESARFSEEVVEPTLEIVEVFAENDKTGGADELAAEFEPQMDDDLPEDWVEQLDPTTDNVYYYNASTNETSWERPSSSMLPSTSDTNEVPKEKESAGFSEEVVEPTLEIAEEFAETDEADEPAAEFEPQMDDDLPEDWVEQLDPTTGNVYYYKASTNETSWERPSSTDAPCTDRTSEGLVPVEGDELALVSQEIVAPAYETVEELAENNEHETAVVDEPVTESGQPDDSLLLEGWTELQDEVTGNIYFYNALTNETTWDRPSSGVNLERPFVPDEVEFDAEILVPGSAEANGVGTTTAQNEDIPEEESVRNDPETEVAEEEYVVLPEVSNGLPPGWSSGVDPSSGTAFYFNGETGETSWDTPVLISHSPAEEGLHPEITVTPTDAAQSAADEATPEETPQALVDSEPESTASPNEEHGRTATHSEADPSTGQQLYHFSPATHETSLEVPPSSDAQPETGVPVERALTHEQIDVTIAVDADISTNDQNLAIDQIQDGINECGSLELQDVDKETLPSPWTEETDPSTRKPYYFNSETLETTWEIPASDGRASQGRPENGADDSVGADANEEESSDDLPEGWVKELEEPSGRFFFYHVDDQVGTTSWERPGPPREADVPEAIREDEQGNDDLGEDDDKEASEEVRQDLVGEPDQKEVSEAGVLPAQELDAWSELVDPSSGDTYYYQASTGETSWEPPHETVGLGNDGELAYSINLKEEPTDTVDHTSGFTAPREIVANQTYESPEAASSTDQKPTKSLAEETRESPPEEAKDPIVEVGNDNPELQIETQYEGVLPRGWVESIDPSTGIRYYVNEILDETTWDRPSTAASDMMIDEAPETTAPPVTDEAEVTPLETSEIAVDTTKSEMVLSEGCGESQSSGDADTKLPNGWAEVVDPASGVPYYYNEATNETSWEMPILQSTSFFLTTGNETSSETPIMQSTSVSLPTENEFLEPEGGDQIEDDKPREVGEESNEEEPENSSNLPPGWVELVDTSTGNPYYYNEVDNMTSWEVPVAEEGNWLPGHSSSPEEVKESDAAMPETKDASDMEFEPHENDAPSKEAEKPCDLLNGWVEVVDESSGRPYYLNEADNTTTWERPEQPARKSSPAAIDDDSVEIKGDPLTEGRPKEEESGVLEATAGTNVNLRNEGELLEGWMELADPSSGNTYYVNEAKGTTTWERPVENDAEAKSSDVPNLTGSKVSELGETTWNDGATPLPHGWATKEDPDSGVIYYFNETEHKTTRDRPMFEEAKATTGTKNKTLGVRTRPLHAFASFGFGGRLCVFRTTCQGRLEMHKVHELVPSHPVIRAEKAKLRFGIVGALHNTESALVSSYIAAKARESTSELLWSLIQIAAQSEGRLRSDEGVADTSSPESSVVQLLLQAESATDGVDGRHEPKVVIDEVVIDEIGSRESLQNIESLLLHGKREEAVQEAVASRQFAMALLVASMCDRATFQHATKQFAKEIASTGSPLYTLALLFSGQLEPPPDNALDRSGLVPTVWSEATEELRHTWKQHLCAIISNRILGWDRIVLSLGDRLLELGDVHAAHCCYMVCGCPVASVLHPDSRISVVGCDHLVPLDAALMTDEGIAAFSRSEAYEWAKRRGNPEATIKSIQGFKLAYAMILADLGYGDAAEAYVRSIRQCTGLLSLETTDFDRNKKAATVWTLAEPDDLDGFLNEFEDRLNFRKNPRTIVGSLDRTETTKEPTSAPPMISITANNTDCDVSFLSAKSNLFDRSDPEPIKSATAKRAALPETKTSGSKPTSRQRRAASKPESEAAQPKQPPPRASTTSVPPVPSLPSVQTRLIPTIADASPKGGAPLSVSPGVRGLPGIRPSVGDQNGSKFPPSAAASGMPPTTPLPSSLIPSIADGPPEGGAPLSAPPVVRGLPGIRPSVGDQNGSKVPPPAASGMPPTMPLSSPVTPLAKEERDSFVPPLPAERALESQPGEKQKKPDKAPHSAPAELQRTKKTPAKTPTSAQKRAWGMGGFRDRMTKWLNPDATTADMGDGMQAYYDEDKKVWVFPGEDPAEVAKPVGPPPTMTTPKKEESKKDVPFDPLAAMMAPPPRSISSVRRQPGTASRPVGFPGMMMPPGAVTPGTPGTPAAGRPPKFMVFTPKNDQKKEEKSEETE